MEWNINPGVSIGPVRLGYERERVIELLGPPLTLAAPRSLGGGPQDFFNGSTIQVHYDRIKRVTACTVWRSGPFLHLDRPCIWFLSRFRMATLVERAWGVTPTDRDGIHWMFPDQRIWFKWNSKRIEAVSVFDKSVPGRVIEEARLHPEEFKQAAMGST